MTLFEKKSPISIPHFGKKNNLKTCTSLLGSFSSVLVSIFWDLGLSSTAHRYRCMYNTHTLSGSMCSALEHRVTCCFQGVQESPYMFPRCLRTRHELSRGSQTVACESHAVLSCGMRGLHSSTAAYTSHSSAVSEIMPSYSKGLL